MHNVLHLIARIGFDVGLLFFYLVVELPARFAQFAFPNLFPRHVPVKSYECVVITGASVGIGAGLARRFARPEALLVLTARRRGSLKETAEYCRNLGATVEEHYVDVCDVDNMDKLIRETHAKRPIDLVVANAGVAPTMDGIDCTREIVSVNLDGMLNTILPAIREHRKTNGERIKDDLELRGMQLVLLSSIGGYAPPLTLFMTPYAATKAAVRRYGEGLRIPLRKDNVGVTVICPGNVESDMTKSHRELGVSMFGGILGIEEASKMMANAIVNNEPELSFPTITYLAARLTGEMPRWASDRMWNLFRINDPYCGIDLQTQKEKRMREHGW